MAHRSKEGVRYDFFLEFNDDEILSDYIAVSLMCRTEVKSLLVNELKLLPLIIRRQMKDNGVVATRFSGDRIQYLLDIELIIRNNLEYFYF